MRSLGRFVPLALLLGGCAAAPTHSNVASTGPVPIAAPPAAGKPRGAPADPAKRSFRENLARANDEADKNGWVPKETIELAGHNAAIVLYDPKPERAPAFKLTRVQAVGTGAYEVVSAESGIIEAVKTRKGVLLWDLRGDGSTSVVLHLTPCGAYCGVAKPLVLELTEDRFKAQPIAPACPTCMKDSNADGIPEFEVRLAELRIAPCSRVSCGPSSALLVEVRGLEVWDGEKYARDLRELQPLYAERLELAKKDAARVRKAGGKSKICPLDPLQVAARLYAFSRMGGESAEDALKGASEVMKGYGFEPCKREFDLLAEPKRWPELESELRGWELPRLERDRKR